MQLQDIPLKVLTIANIINGKSITMYDSILSNVNFHECNFGDSEKYEIPESFSIYIKPNIKVTDMLEAFYGIRLNWFQKIILKLIVDNYIK